MPPRWPRCCSASRKQRRSPADSRKAGSSPPALLGFEIASVCLKKLRRDPKRRDALLTAFALYARMPIEIVEVEHADTIELAEVSGLTSYDAAYLWLVQKLDAELVTLDKRLQTAGAERR